MREIKPKNESCAAVELALSHPVKISPFRAAYVATQLVTLGAQFQRVSTRLLGGQDEWGPYPQALERMDRATNRRERLIREAKALIAPWGTHGRVEVSDDGLRLNLHTRVRGHAEMTTLTRG